MSSIDKWLMLYDRGLLERALSCKHPTAFDQGVRDGYEQGFELSLGMTYDDAQTQWEYDTGAHIGACLAAHPSRTK